jgi:hypothetical protein
MHDACRFAAPVGAVRAQEFLGLSVVPGTRDADNHVSSADRQLS